MTLDQNSYEARCDWLDGRIEVNDNEDYQLFDEAVANKIANGRTEVEARNIVFKELF